MRSPALRVALVVALTAVGAACHKRAPTKAPPSADAGALEDAGADSADGDAGAQADDDTLWGAVRELPHLVASTRAERERVLQHHPLDRDSLEAEVTT